MIPTRLYTIGHGRRSFTELLAAMERHGVRTIVDVRSEPYSKHAPDFTRPLLDNGAAAAGIGYRWFGDLLGGRPSRRELRTSTGATDWAALAADPAFQGAVAEVAELSREAAVVLLCAETEPEHCHRTFLLSPAMAEQGFEILHILGDGSTRPNQPSLFVPGDGHQTEGG